jgi:hypothetical protein
MDKPGLGRIALVNAALFAPTLTVYRFWAKADVRRHIWSCVHINGEPLEYTGRGIDYDGSVHSLPRMLDMKAKEVRARLGEEENLPGCATCAKSPIGSRPESAGLFAHRTRLKRSCCNVRSNAGRRGMALRGARAHAHRKLDFLPEQSQDRHKPVEREPSQIGAADTGKVRVADSGRVFRLAGRPASVIENLDDFGCHERLGLQQVSVVAAKITKDVAAAADQFDVVFGAHFNISFNLLIRSRIRSVSCFGVLMPLLDFFWKA